MCFLEFSYGVGVPLFFSVCVFYDIASVCPCMQYGVLVFLHVLVCSCKPCVSWNFSCKDPGSMCLCSLPIQLCSFTNWGQNTIPFFPEAHLVLIRTHIIMMMLIDSSQITEQHRGSLHCGRTGQSQNDSRRTGQSVLSSQNKFDKTKQQHQFIQENTHYYDHVCWQLSTPWAHLQSRSLERVKSQGTSKWPVLSS